jgi:hypothetical protein
VAGLQTSRSLNTAQAARLQGAEAKLKALRQAVAGAASNAALNQQLQQLQGPVLGPADIAQPLPLLKAQVAAVLDQAALQISREREVSQPRTPLLLLPELLRNALASLAMALGFAALARRPGSDLSLLQELQIRTRRSKQGLSRRSGTTDAEYLQQLGRGDRELERRFDALMLRCTEAEASNANHARHRGRCVGRRQRVGAAPGRVRRKSGFEALALCPDR